ncbi:hypothetical protein LOD99_11620 [Oopsacas minuta]|uniref:Gustatory receptor n=1 Tax=Oopsacas minuta TaxID=111878 RepID=A0AAV7JKN2_9METZ|nr:hypothetical protein LOD99_11620 [Oopsacas minuta]
MEFIDVLFDGVLVLMNLSSSTLLFFSLFWLLFLISELKRVYPLWQYQRRLSTHEGNLKAVDYRNNLVKNSLGLIFVVIELITFSIETLEGIARRLIIEITNKDISNPCVLVEQSYLWWNVQYSVIRILETIRQSGMLLLPAVLTVMVMHLQSIYSGFDRRVSIKKFIILTVASLFALLITKSMLSTLLIAETIYMIALPILFYLLVKNTHSLYSSMQRRVVDISHEGNSHRMLYLREKRLVRTFRWKIIPMYTSAGIGIFGQVLYVMIYAGVGSVFMNSCWFGTQYNIHVNVSYNNTFTEATEYFVFLSRFLYFLTGNLFLWTVIIVNVCILVGVLIEKMRGCYPRHSVSLQACLIENI